MMRDLDGKLALVTGGAKGVGKVICKQLVDRGAQIIINCFHSYEAAKQTKLELEAQGTTVDVMRASVAMEHQVAGMFKEIEEKYGFLDILVNNAASGAFRTAEEVKEEDFARALNTNLKGSFWCSRHARPLMAKRGGGIIVNVSSVGAGLVPANYLVVGTSKAAVESLTRYLAVEYAQFNIRVNTASASMIEGEVARAFPRYDEMRQSIIRATPLQRIGSAEDLAGVVTFLTSNLSQGVTGQMVLADGGLSLSSDALSPPRQMSAASSDSPPEAGKLDPTCSPARQVIADVKQRPASLSADRAATSPRANGRTFPPQGDSHTAHPSGRRDPDSFRSDPNEIVTDDIAVVGMGLAVPGANNPEEYWRLMGEGRNLFDDVPTDRWDYRFFSSRDPKVEDKTYQSKSGFMTDFVPTAALREQTHGDLDEYEYTTLWLRHSLLDAWQGHKRREGDRVSFVIGYTADGSQHLEEASVLTGTLARLRELTRGIVDSDATTPELFDQIEAALKKRYWRGASSPRRFMPHEVGKNAMHGVLPHDTEILIVDTACSSSLYAVDIGIKGLLMGKHDVAVCGGAFALAPRGSVLFANLQGLSKSGEVRPLDQACDGVLFSDGAGVVVLKKLQRAVEDGDRVLAVIKAIGSSSDGKGKAIYAPSSRGQCIAIDRALSHPAAELRHVDWVVAHATGTPAGDAAEFTSLRESFKSDHPVYVTSNKSLIGHTGWAAGVASLIQVILGLQKNAIPPQHRFSATPAHYEIENTNLVIPTSHVAWEPKEGAPRAASISGFGFGGTNAHMLVEEHIPDKPPAPAAAKAYHERMAIVAWSAHFPGLSSSEEVKAWLSGQGKDPDRSFGETYPLPPFEKVRMPPAAARTIDRCQLMALECAHALRSQIGSTWEKHLEKTGVFMGHMGPTRNSTLYASRCYLDEIEHILQSQDSIRQSPHFQPLLDGLKQIVKKLVPPSNENSFPGMMPNVIPARIANFFDLKGLNMTIDTGCSSTLTALEVATRYLKSNELDMALVGGINGNTTPEMQSLVEGLINAPALAEGALLFALVTETTAVAEGLPILAYVEDFEMKATSSDPGQGARPVPDTTRHPSYLAAEGAVEILSAILSDEPETTIVCSGEPAVSLKVSKPGGKEAAGSQPQTNLPSQLYSEEECEPGRPLEVQRQVSVLEAFPMETVRPGVAFFPPRCLLLTNRPELLDLTNSLPEDLIVLSTEPLATDAPNRFYLPEVTPENVERLIDQFKQPIQNLRVLTDLNASAPVDECLWTEPSSLIALHDLAFLALKQCFGNLREGHSSFASLFLDAIRSGVLHPFAGLFGGMIKTAALELQECVTYGVFSSATELDAGVQQAQEESRAKHFLPIIVYDDGTRKTIFLDETAGDLPREAEARVNSDSVILAVGGARGITAELLKAVAQHFQPHVYLIGSNRLQDYPPDIFAVSDEDFAKQRATYLLEQRKAHPDKTLGKINKEFERMKQARAARQNIDTMTRYCGAGRVHYITCDVLDREMLAQVVSRIVQEQGQIDLLINAAGLNRSASISTKGFEDFRVVRDIKLQGYQNLKYALRRSPPRMWCNFGSFIGLTGQLGEVDYASANDFLATSATYTTEALGCDEFTIGWTLWDSVGLGANPITKAFLAKSALFTSMSTPEGIHHFLRELNLARRDPSTVHLGVAEKKAITDYVPDYFTRRKSPSEKVESAFYLGKVLSRGEREIVFERVFDLQTDGYLNHHLVDGHPTLPGTFVPEIAAEAAAHLLPGLHVVGIEDVVFHHFLRVYEGKPTVKRIQAEILQGADEQAIVQVRVLTDVVAPNGVVLTKDKLHFEAKVILSERFPRAPSWQSWNSEGEFAVPDPYHFDSAPVRLTDMFVSTKDTRSHPLGKRAIYDLQIGQNDPVFNSFLLPTILLDGLARIAVLNFVQDDYIPLAAPATIRRIDFYEAANDCRLAQKYDPIDLYATPREFSLEQKGGGNRFVAVRPDGQVITQMKDVTGIIMGYVHKTTGEFVARNQLDSRLEAAVAG